MLFDVRQVLKTDEKCLLEWKWSLPSNDVTQICPSPLHSPSQINAAWELGVFSGDTPLDLDGEPDRESGRVVLRECLKQGLVDEALIHGVTCQRRLLAQERSRRSTNNERSQRKHDMDVGRQKRKQEGPTTFTSCT